MHRTLQACFVRSPYVLFQFSFGDVVVDHQPRSVRSVVEWFEEQRGSGAKRPVHECLQPTQPHPVTSSTRIRNLIRLALPLTHRRPGIDSHRQPALFATLPVRIVILPRRYILNRSNTNARSFGQRCYESLASLDICPLGDHSKDESLRVILKDSRWLIALWIANDGPACRVRGLLCDSGEPQRRAVGQAHMPVQSREEHRVVSGEMIDQLFRWQLRIRPSFVIPITTGNPAAGG